MLEYDEWYTWKNNGHCQFNLFEKAQRLIIIK
jgi:hypothetical protein